MDEHIPILGRSRGRANGVATPLGEMPRYQDLNWAGLEKVSKDQYAKLEKIDPAAWKDELASHDELFSKFGTKLPRALDARRGKLHQELS